MSRLKEKKYLFLSLAIVLGVTLVITAIAKNSFAVTYRCPSGFTPIAGTSGAMCEKAADVKEKITYSCSEGELQVNRCYITKPAETKTGTETYYGTIDHYKCSTGSLDGSGCYDFTSKEYYCYSGTLSGSSCKHSQRMNVNSCTGTCSNTISDGGTVTCMCTWKTSASKKCPSGYSEYANGSTCRKSVGSATAYYKCDDGTVSTSKTCTRTVSAKQCPRGYTEVAGTGGNVCSKTVSATESIKYNYSCSSGNLNESTKKCEIAAERIGDENNCPIGSVKEGNTCRCTDSNYTYNSANNKCERNLDADFNFDIERPSNHEFVNWCKANGGSIVTVDSTSNIVKCIKSTSYSTNTEYPDTSEFRQWCSSIGGSINKVSGTNLAVCYSNITCGTNAAWNNATKKCVCLPGWAGNPTTGCTTDISDTNKDYIDKDGNLLCTDGYSENANGICVKNSDFSESGVYYISGGKCKPYPGFNGYCIEKGAPYNSHANFTTVSGKHTSLTCEQMAAAYIGFKSSSKNYAVQSILNGRTYYSDSNCTKAISTASVRSEASRMCQNINFGSSPSASGTNSTNNNIFSRFANLFSNNKVKTVKVSLDGQTISLKKGSSTCLEDTSGYLGSYTVTRSGNGDATYQISGNKFCITAGQIEGTTTFTLTRSIISGTTTTGSTKYIDPEVKVSDTAQNYISGSNEYEDITEVPEYSVIRKSVSVIVSDDAQDLKGGFKIIKKNSEGTPLEGVEFLIGESVKDGQIVNPTTKKTDSNGEILFEDLPAGKMYYYQEKSTLTGYILDDEIRSLKINANEVLEVTLINYSQEKGGFRILKVDNLGNPLKNVKFKVGEKLDGTEGVDWKYMTTGEKGIITVGDLELNKTYYYQEVEAPNGYYLDGSVKEIKINETKIEDIPVVNERYTRDVIVRKISEDEKPLAGAIIEIYNADDNTLIETGITDKDGIIKFTNLTYGNYYALEKEAPKGYELNAKKHEFTITDLTDSLLSIPMINYKIDNPQTADLPIILIITLGLIGIGYGIYKYRMMKLNKEQA